MTTATHPTGHARISLRTSPEAKALIERAAALTGATVSSFILHTACETARQVVANHDTLMLSQQAFADFVTECEAAKKPNEALRALMARN